jgi:DMSO/TMAO reductase YedYZ molybdopterin-dependent catalytic subunit
VAAGCRGIVVKDLDELATAFPDQATRVARTSVFTPTPRPTSPPPLARNFGFDTPIRLTAQEDFYQVQYGAIPTPGDVAGWRLVIDGDVEEVVELTLADIEALTQHRIMRTLECISNPAGGDLIGNAVWDGVAFRDVLALARPRPGAGELKMEALDGYHTGVALEVAMDPESYLVFAMNGEPLEMDHGYPARCLFPGKYGQKQPKWLTHVTVQSGTHTGHWEAQGWSHEANVKINSRIDAPRSGATVQPEAAVAGIAFSDLSGVSRVEVLVDDVPAGDAELVRAPEPYTRTVWTEWRWEGGLAPGDHAALARASDGNGLTQRRAREGLLEGTKPDGTSEMHRVTFSVR